MNKKVVSLAIIAIILLASVGVFFSYRESISRGNRDEVHGIRVEERKITENPAPLSIDVAYPYIEGEDGFNQKVKSIVDAEINGFKEIALENDAAVKEMDPEGYQQYPRQYDLKISYAKDQPDENTVSIVFSTYNYSGGAHGNGYYDSVTYNVRDDKEITLKDIFAGDSEYLKKISEFATQDLTKQLTERTGSIEGAWLQDGASPKEENFSNFMLHNNTITFYFPPYQLAAYAVGSFEVTMPR